ncbi:isoprenoid biosynthesis glyoxalase ElbB [bacterium]|nr:isoprenoid biosynthesis glyoxalase ElbB [bacterium]
MKKVAVILSGCGVFDGTEIHEAVLTLLYLDRAGAEVQCYAPDKPQMHVVNHATGNEAEGESRNVLEESARIARGAVKPLHELNMSETEAIVFPGGFGAAKNLSNFATNGADCEVDQDIKVIIQEAVESGKVVGVICISPVLAAKALQEKGIKTQLTIGNDQETASALQAMGSENVDTPVNDIYVDEENKIVSTPAYMLGPSISHVALGIKKLVDKVLEM